MAKRRIFKGCVALSSHGAIIESTFKPTFKPTKEHALAESERYNLFVNGINHGEKRVIYTPLIKDE